MYLMSEIPLTRTIYSISIVISYVIFSSSEQKKKMIPYVTCRVPLRVSAPTVIPVSDHWNRSKMEVLSTQDGQMRIQGQTNISSATAADKLSVVRHCKLVQCKSLSTAVYSQISDSTSM